MYVIRYDIYFACLLIVVYSLLLLIGSVCNQVMSVFMIFRFPFLFQLNMCTCVCPVRLVISGSHLTSTPEFLLTVMTFFTKGKPRHLEKPKPLVFDTGVTATDKGHLMWSRCFVVDLHIKTLQQH